MEDYKKKYENLLHDIDIAIAGQKEGETKIVLQNLKERHTESKDERMRKKCISIIDAWDIACRLQGDYCEVAPECIAWLEKQGEHANFRNKIQIGDEVTRNEDGALVNLSQFKRMVKQGEQKSLNKVEQEDVELTDFESALFSAFSDAWQEYLSGKEVNVAKWAREHSAELLEVARGQISAWSEEDEDNYVTALWHIKRSSGREGSVYNWLKSIKDRMKGENI